jgi:translation initiation factor 2 subunit 1
MYPKKYELVFCTVTRITPFAAWCTLDEYSDENNKIEGMIHVSEVAGKWVKDIRNFVKQNKQYVAKVMRVDPAKGHINLSLKRVSKFDKRQKVENYRKYMRASNILEQTAKRLNKSLEDAQAEVVHKLEGQFENLFEAFEEESENPGTLAEAGVSKEWVDVIQELIAKLFEKKEVVIKAVVNLSSTAPDGVEKVKQVLNGIEKDAGVKPKYVSAPKYRLELETKDPKNAEKKLRTVLEDAVKGIEKFQGTGSYEIVK